MQNMLIVVIVVLRIRCNHYLKLSENQVLEGQKGLKLRFKYSGNVVFLTLKRLPNWCFGAQKQFVVSKQLSYCFKETIRFDVKNLFASRPVSRLIRWYNKPGDVTKEFW